MRVLDGAVAVFCSVGGVEPQSETVWRQADKYNVPRIAYVNKMDRVGADFQRAIDMMKDRLGANAVPIQWPIGVEDSFRGMVDLITMKAHIFTDDLGTKDEEADIPEELVDVIAEARERMLEAVADIDEDIMMKYLEGEEITVDELKKAIRRGVIDVKITPVLCGSSFKNKGVQLLLDAIVDYLPSPMDLPPIAGTEVGSGAEASRNLDDSSPLSALAFKVMSDPYVGKLVYVRIYSGILQAGSYVYNASKGKKERVGRILRMHANHREEVKECYSGDIVAIVGLRDTATGDTLCAEDAPIILEQLEFPEPVINQAVEPKTKTDQDKLGTALQKLAEEDPTFRVHTDEETGQTIISGMGELHLEVIVDRLLREFKVEANIGKPQVAYRETITKAVTTEGKFVRQSGGRGQYGHVVLEIEPLEQGAGFEFVNKIVGGVVPREYIPAVESGVKEAMLGGVLAGYPVVDVRVTITDGSYHEVDSSEMAFKVAGSIGFKEGARKANPVLLEPIMKVEVTTPEEYLGDVMGDLNSRRGRIEKMEARGNAQVVSSFVPLSEMFGYATDLRSATQGRATYSMNFSHYEPVPASIGEELMHRNL